MILKLCHIFTLFVSLVLVGCSGPVSKTELLSYLNNPNNKLVYVDSTDGVIYKVYFKPSDLIACQYLNKQDSTISIDSLKNAHKNYVYISLNVSYMGKDLFSRKIPDIDFNALQKRVSFDLRDYISLQDNVGNDYQLIDSNYPRLYGMIPSTNILLVFKKDKVGFSESYTLKVKDFVTNTSDQLKFTFSKKDILNAPELNFDLIL